MRRLTLSLLLASGCSTQLEVAPAIEASACREAAHPKNEALALSVFWEPIYNGHEPPPLVEWLEGDCAPRADSMVRGGYRHERGDAWVAADGPEEDRWRAHAHVLLHARFDRALGNEDARHERAEWAVVDPVVQMMRERGVW